jgi:tRNA (guanine37-N1)-methyltransferase
VRIDVVTIFPGYLAPLELSLAGKAREKGLLDIRVHDLRSWTTDRHHTVDDTPYGGGAGMVMRPEPWGAALDDLLGEHGAGRAERVGLGRSPACGSTSSRSSRATWPRCASVFWFLK